MLKFARSSIAAVAATGVVASAGLVAMASGQSADAAAPTVTVGSNPAVATLLTCPASSIVQTSVADPAISYVVPDDGTLTNFTYRAVNATGTVQMIVLRPTSTAGTYATVGASPVENINASNVNQLDTFPVTIQVLTGDVIGLKVSANMDCGGPTQGDTFGVDFGYDPASSPTFVSGGGVQGITNVSATLQPSTATVTATATQTVTATATATATVTATQTATETATATTTVTAPTQTATVTQTATATATATRTVAPTPSPDTTAPDTFLLKSPRARVHKRKAAFEFVSSDLFMTTTFQCSIDGAQFTVCTSRVIKKFSRGKHTFEVRAIDPAGNVDATPATVKWKFVPQKNR